MLRYLRMAFFHLAQFSRVPYFVALMVTSTLSVLLVQALAIFAWGGDPWVAWTRSGIIGTWTTTTVAAGILGFERYKGTLVHLVSSRTSPYVSLSAIVSAASLFGLLSFAVAWISWGLIFCRSHIGFGSPPLPIHTILMSIYLLWVGCAIISYVIASIFVLTPNAIAYEDLLLTPVFFLSGIIFTSMTAPKFVGLLGPFLPIWAPAQILIGNMPSESISAELIRWVVVCVVWMLLALALMRFALRRARIDGTLEVM